MKQKLSTIDVAAEAACLRARILGMRVVNVYDIDARVRSLHSRFKQLPAPSNIHGF